MRRWLSLLMVAAGCSSSQVDGSVETPGITVTAESDRPSVAAGQQLQVTVIVTNTSAAPRTLRFASACLTTVEFLDGAGKVVGASQPVCAQVLTERTLAGGGSFSDSHTWTRGPLDQPQLQPGSYRLRGVLLATGDTVRSAPVPLSLP